MSGRTSFLSACLLLCGCPGDKAGVDTGCEDDGEPVMVELGAGPECGTAVISALIVGEEEGDYASTRSGSGDYNGDGLGDILVGAPYADRAGENSGIGYVLLGPVDGTVSVSTAVATLTGANAGDLAGELMGGVGDVDADGYDDLTSAVQADHVPTAINLFFGPLAGDMAADAGEARIDVGSYGYAAGDANGDGYDDILARVSAKADVLNTIYLFAGPVATSVAADDATLKIEDSSGGSCTPNSAGDTDADGMNDVLIGCPSNMKYLILGGSTGTLSTDDADSWIEESTSSFGGAGDTNGDGYGDLLVTAAPGHRTTYVIPGMIAPGEFSIEDSEAAWTTALYDDYLSMLTFRFDVNADGFSDFALETDAGYDEYSEYSTNIHIILSPTSGSHLVDDADFTVTSYGTGLGAMSAAALDDTDGDGYDDLTLVLSSDDRAVKDPGAMFLLRGGTF